MNIIKNINVMLRFLLEVILVISLMYYGLKNPTRGFVKLGLGIIFPVLVVIFWSIYIAPKSPNTLVGVKRLLVEVIIIASTITAIYYTGEKSYATWLGIFAVINTILLYVLKG